MTSNHLPTSIPTLIRDDTGARLLDPQARFDALYHDLPSLRTALGERANTLLEDIVQDVFYGVACQYRQLLQSTQDYNHYPELIGAAALEGERLFRSDFRVWRDFQLDEQTLQQVIRLLKFRLVTYLETTL